jgi:hypothetical protein
VRLSNRDSAVRLYYRSYVGLRGGNRWVCVAARIGSDDAFVATAYGTRSMKKGETLWKRQ